MNTVTSLRVSDRLWGLDPGGLRLRNALRSTICCTLAGVIGITWCTRQHVPLIVAAFTILFAMIAPLFIRETQRTSFLTTLAWVYLTAAAAYVIAAALAHSGLFGDLGFLFVFFVGILCQACGPRALGCALASIVTYYLGLYLSPTLAEVGESLVLSLPAVFIIIVVGRVLLPVRPAVVLQRAIKSVLSRASTLVQLLSAQPQNTAALDRQISFLNEAALALEEHLSLFPMPGARSDAIRECLVELELAAGQCHYAKTDGTHSATSSGLPALQKAILRLRENVQTSVSTNATPRAAHTATHARVPAATPQTAAVTPALTALGFTQKWQDFASRLSWLHASRATTAAILAMFIGHSLSPERWFWAVITTFVVFLGTRSRADTIHRGFERVGGTLAGALVSAGLALSLHGMTALLLLAMVLCVFGWSYFILSSYSRGVFFITVLVGLIYSELGFAIGPLVAIRIEEVLLGCVISFAVAAFVFPVSASKHIDSRMLAVLKALRDVVDKHANTLPAAPAQRRLEKSWHELRTAFRPFQTQRVFVWNPGCELVTGSLLACLHWTRLLANEASTSANQRQSSAILQQIDAMIRQYDAEECRAVTTAYVVGNDGIKASMPIAIAAGAGAVATSTSTSTPNQTATLRQLRASIEQLADRLGHSPAQRTGVRWALRAVGG